MKILNKLKNALPGYFIIGKIRAYYPSQWILFRESVNIKPGFGF